MAATATHLDLNYLKARFNIGNIVASSVYIHETHKTRGFCIFLGVNFRFWFTSFRDDLI